MENYSENDQQNGQEQRPGRGGSYLMGMLLLATLILVILNFLTAPESEITYDFFLKQIEAEKIEWVRIGTEDAHGKFRGDPPFAPVIADAKVKKDGDKPADDKKSDEKPATKRQYKQQFVVVLPKSDAERSDLYKLLKANGTVVTNDRDNSSTILFMLSLLIPLALILFLWFSLRRTRDQIMGGGFLSGFSKSPAKRYEPIRQPVTFDDVAGIDSVKADLEEVVDFLKNPKKYQRLGGQVPKGVLLNGSPGTGKTLLARAVAGEAGVPFYSVNGSEFIQMFVGVGASRVRDLFKNAKDNSPAIIFVDEIDAVGRQRGAGLGGGHDEREQTLNQILSEMDGFNPVDAVIVVAATNRPDVLDPALLRPGRFDRHITVNRPTAKGRREIFKVHVRDVPLADDVDIERLARNTVGLTGADIRNVVNEAALWAARRDGKVVRMTDFDHARDKILMGAKREEIFTEEEKLKTAYHEAGHTITAWKLPGADQVYKVSVIPRGRALGVTQYMPLEDRLNASEKSLRDQLIMLLGGRAAERLIYNETTVGAENDLERATQLARRMVTHWGMSDKLGPVSYKMADEDPFLGREMHKQRQFSEATMELIDAEVGSILAAAEERCNQMIAEYKQELTAVAEALMEEEELDTARIEELIGPSVHGTVLVDKDDETDSSDASASGDAEPEDGSSDAEASAESETAET